MAQLLLDRGADVDAKRNDVSVAACYVVCRRRVMSRRALIQCWPSTPPPPPNQQPQGQTPLSIAACKGHKDVAQLLLERGAIVPQDMVELLVRNAWPVMLGCKCMSTHRESQKGGGEVGVELLERKRGI